MTTKTQKKNAIIFSIYTIFACIGAISSLLLTIFSENYISNFHKVIDIIYAIILIVFAILFYNAVRQEHISDKKRTILLILLSLCAIISMTLYNNDSGLLKFIKLVLGKDFYWIYSYKLNYITYAIPFVIRHLVFAFTFSSLLKGKYNDYIGKTTIFFAFLYFCEALYATGTLITYSPQEIKYSLITSTVRFVIFAVYSSLVLLRNRNKIFFIISNILLLCLVSTVLFQEIPRLQILQNLEILSSSPAAIVNGFLFIVVGTICILIDSIKTIKNQSKNRRRINEF